MTLKITVYNQNQFTKYGKLKKNASCEFGRTIGDTGELTGDNLDAFLKETAELLKKEYHGFESPYVFTHIKALNANNEQVYIYEDVTKNGVSFMTSPTKLLEYLK